MSLENGIHYFGGICDVQINCAYTEFEPDNFSNGYIIRIDNENYVIYEDPADGFRSYGKFSETKMKCTNTFPPQKVKTELFDSGWTVDEYGDHHYEGLRITNPNDGSLILEIATMWTDLFYPCAHMEYHPENLPNNKGRSPIGH